MRGRSTGLLVALAVVLAIGAGVGLGAVLFGDGDSGGGASATTTEPGGSNGSDGSDESDGSDGSPSETTPTDLPATTVPEAGLSGAALELAQAINRAHQLSYHITLQSVDADSHTEVELWRRLPNARRDTRLGEAPNQIATSEFRDPVHGHVGCLLDLADPENISCLQAPSGQVDPADPVLGAVDPTAGPVEASNDTVNGVPVRCFTVTVTDDSSPGARVACFDAEGIPAVIDGGDGRLERVGEIDRGITDDAFVIPSDLFSDGGSDSGSSP